MTCGLKNKEITALLSAAVEQNRKSFLDTAVAKTHAVFDCPTIVGVLPIEPVQPDLYLYCAEVAWFDFNDATVAQDCCDRLCEMATVSPLHPLSNAGPPMPGVAVAAGDGEGSSKTGGKKSSAAAASAAQAQQSESGDITATLPEVQFGAGGLVLSSQENRVRLLFVRAALEANDAVAVRGLREQPLISQISSALAKMVKGIRIALQDTHSMRHLVWIGARRFWNAAVSLYRPGSMRAITSGIGFVTQALERVDHADLGERCVWMIRHATCLADDGKVGEASSMLAKAADLSSKSAPGLRHILTRVQLGLAGSGKAGKDGGGKGSAAQSGSLGRSLVAAHTALTGLADPAAAETELTQCLEELGAEIAAVMAAKRAHTMGADEDGTGAGVGSPGATMTGKDAKKGSQAQAQGTRRKSQQGAINASAEDPELSIKEEVYAELALAAALNGRIPLDFVDEHSSRAQHMGRLKARVLAEFAKAVLTAAKCGATRAARHAVDFTQCPPEMLHDLTSAIRRIERALESALRLPNFAVGVEDAAGPTPTAAQPGVQNALAAQAAAGQPPLSPGGKDLKDPAAIAAAQAQAQLQLQQATQQHQRSDRQQTVQLGCVLLWNASLILLQPDTRGLLSKPFQTASKALDEVGSNMKQLNAQFRFESACCDFDAGFLHKVKDHCKAALGMDYTPSADMIAKYGMQRPLDRLLQPMADRTDAKADLYKKPDTPEAAALAVLEQAAESGLTTAQKIPLLRRAVDALESSEPSADFHNDANQFISEQLSAGADSGAGGKKGAKKKEDTSGRMSPPMTPPPRAGLDGDSPPEKRKRDLLRHRATLWAMVIALGWIEPQRSLPPGLRPTPERAAQLAAIPPCRVAAEALLGRKWLRPADRDMRIAQARARIALAEMRGAELAAQGLHLGQVQFLHSSANEISADADEDGLDADHDATTAAAGTGGVGANNVAAALAVGSNTSHTGSQPPSQDVSSIVNTSGSGSAASPSSAAAAAVAAAEAEVVAEAKKKAELVRASEVEVFTHLTEAAAIGSALVKPEPRWRDEWIVCNACIAAWNCYATAFSKNNFLSSAALFDALGPQLVALAPAGVDPTTDVQLFANMASAQSRGQLQIFIAETLRRKVPQISADAAQQTQQLQQQVDGIFTGGGQALMSAALQQQQHGATGASMLSGMSGTMTMSGADGAPAVVPEFPNSGQPVVPPAPPAVPADIVTRVSQIDIAKYQPPANVPVEANHPKLARAVESCEKTLALLPVPMDGSVLVRLAVYGRRMQNRAPDARSNSQHKVTSLLAQCQAPAATAEDRRKWLSDAYEALEIDPAMELCARLAEAALEVRSIFCDGIAAKATALGRKLYQDGRLGHKNAPIVSVLSTGGAGGGKSKSKKSADRPSSQTPVGFGATPAGASAMSKSADPNEPTPESWQWFSLLLQYHSAVTLRLLDPSAQAMEIQNALRQQALVALTNAASAAARSPVANRRAMVLRCLGQYATAVREFNDGGASSRFLAAPSLKVLLGDGVLKNVLPLPPLPTRAQTNASSQDSATTAAAAKKTKPNAAQVGAGGVEITTTVSGELEGALSTTDCGGYGEASSTAAGGSASGGSASRPGGDQPPPTLHPAHVVAELFLLQVNCLIDAQSVDAGLAASKRALSILPSSLHRSLWEAEVNLRCKAGLSLHTLLLRIREYNASTQARVWMAVARNAVQIEDQAFAFKKAIEILNGEPVMMAKHLISFAQWCVAANYTRRDSADAQSARSRRSKKSTQKPDASAGAQDDASSSTGVDLETVRSLLLTAVDCVAASAGSLDHLPSSLGGGADADDMSEVRSLRSGVGAGAGRGQSVQHGRGTVTTAIGGAAALGSNGNRSSSASRGIGGPAGSQDQGSVLGSAVGGASSSAAAAMQRPIIEELCVAIEAYAALAAVGPRVPGENGSVRSPPPASSTSTSNANANANTIGNATASSSASLTSYVPFVDGVPCDKASALQMAAHYIQRLWSVTAAAGNAFNASRRRKAQRDAARDAQLAGNVDDKPDAPAPTKGKKDGRGSAGAERKKSRGSLVKAAAEAIDLSSLSKGSDSATVALLGSIPEHITVPAQLGQWAVFNVDSAIEFGETFRVMGLFGQATMSADKPSSAGASGAKVSGAGKQASNIGLLGLTPQTVPRPALLLNVLQTLARSFAQSGMQLQALTTHHLAVAAATALLPAGDSIATAFVQSVRLNATNICRGIGAHGAAAVLDVANPGASAREAATLLEAARMEGRRIAQKTAGPHGGGQNENANDTGLLQTSMSATNGQGMESQQVPARNAAHVEDTAIEKAAATLQDDTLRVYRLWLDSAAALLDAGRFSSAAALITDATTHAALFHDRRAVARGYHLHARVLHAQGHFKEALKSAGMSVTHDPAPTAEFVGEHGLLEALCLLALGDVKEALTAHARAQVSLRRARTGAAGVDGVVGHPGDLAGEVAASTIPEVQRTVCQRFVSAVLQWYSSTVQGAVDWAHGDLVSTSATSAASGVSGGASGHAVPAVAPTTNAVHTGGKIPAVVADILRRTLEQCVDDTTPALCFLTPSGNSAGAQADTHVGLIAGGQGGQVGPTANAGGNAMNTTAAAIARAAVNRQAPPIAPELLLLSAKLDRLDVSVACPLPVPTGMGSATSDAQDDLEAQPTVSVGSPAESQVLSPTDTNTPAQGGPLPTAAGAGAGGGTSAGATPTSVADAGIPQMLPDGGFSGADLATERSRTSAKTADGAQTRPADAAASTQSKMTQALSWQRRRLLVEEKQLRRAIATLRSMVSEFGGRGIGCRAGKDVFTTPPLVTPAAPAAPVSARGAGNSATSAHAVGKDGSHAPSAATAATHHPTSTAVAEAVAAQAAGGGVASGLASTSINASGSALANTTGVAPALCVQTEQEALLSEAMTMLAQNATEQSELRRRVLHEFRHSSTTALDFPRAMARDDDSVGTAGEKVKRARALEGHIVSFMRASRRQREAADRVAAREKRRVDVDAARQAAREEKQRTVLRRRALHIAAQGLDVQKSATMAQTLSADLKPEPSSVASKSPGAKKAGRKGAGGGKPPIASALSPTKDLKDMDPHQGSMNIDGGAVDLASLPADLQDVLPTDTCGIESPVNSDEEGDDGAAEDSASEDEEEIDLALATVAPLDDDAQFAIFGRVTRPARNIDAATGKQIAGQTNAAQQNTQQSVSRMSETNPPGQSHHARPHDDDADGGGVVQTSPRPRQSATVAKRDKNTAGQNSMEDTDSALLGQDDAVACALAAVTAGGGPRALLMYGRALRERHFERAAAQERRVTVLGQQQEPPVLTGLSPSASWNRPIDAEEEGKKHAAREAAREAAAAAPTKGKGKPPPQAPTPSLPSVGSAATPITLGAPAPGEILAPDAAAAQFSPGLALALRSIEDACRIAHSNRDWNLLKVGLLEHAQVLASFGVLPSAGIAHDVAAAQHCSMAVALHRLWASTAAAESTELALNRGAAAVPEALKNGPHFMQLAGQPSGLFAHVAAAASTIVQTATVQATGKGNAAPAPITATHAGANHVLGSTPAAALNAAGMAARWALPDSALPWLLQDAGAAAGSAANIAEPPTSLPGLPADIAVLTVCLNGGDLFGALHRPGGKMDIRRGWIDVAAVEAIIAELCQWSAQKETALAALGAGEDLLPSGGMADDADTLGDELEGTFAEICQRTQKLLASIADLLALLSAIGAKHHLVLCVDPLLLPLPLEAAFPAFQKCRSVAREVSYFSAIHKLQRRSIEKFGGTSAAGVVCADPFGEHSGFIAAACGVDTRTLPTAKEDSADKDLTSSRMDRPTSSNPKTAGKPLTLKSHHWTLLTAESPEAGTLGAGSPRPMSGKKSDKASRDKDKKSAAAASGADSDVDEKKTAPTAGADSVSSGGMSVRPVLAAEFKKAIGSTPCHAPETKEREKEKDSLPQFLLYAACGGMSRGGVFSPPDFAAAELQHLRLCGVLDRAVTGASMRREDQLMAAIAMGTAAAMKGNSPTSKSAPGGVGAEGEAGKQMKEQAEVKPEDIVAAKANVAAAYRREVAGEAVSQALLLLSRGAQSVATTLWPVSPYATEFGARLVIQSAEKGRNIAELFHGVLQPPIGAPIALIQTGGRYSSTPLGGLGGGGGASATEKDRERLDKERMLPGQGKEEYQQSVQAQSALPASDRFSFVVFGVPPDDGAAAMPAPGTAQGGKR